MSAPKSLVSGGTGFVGRFIAEGLLEAGHAVTVAGRSKPAEDVFSRPVAYRPMSLEPGAVSPELFEGVDFFVHGAFDHVPGRYRGGEGEDAEGFRRRNLDGSVALFAAAKAAGVKRCVFLSSRAVYGQRPPGVMLDEADEAKPDTLYGQVKLAAEEALASMADEGFATASLRITGVYGPAGGGRAHKWSDLFAGYFAGKPVAPRAATEVHGGDVAAAVRLMLDGEAGAVSGRCFNVSDILADRRDILAIVKKATACPHPLPEPADKEAVNAMRTQRLKALGWKPGGMALLEKTVTQLAGEALGSRPSTW